MGNPIWNPGGLSIVYRNYMATLLSCPRYKICGNTRTTHFTAWSKASCNFFLVGILLNIFGYQPVYLPGQFVNPMSQAPEP